MKKAMKWLSLMLCVALLFTTLAACSGDAGKETTTGAEETTAAENETTAAEDETTEAKKELVTKEIEEGKVYNIGICQLAPHPALDAATKGFKERLTALLGKEHVKFNDQNAAGDAPTCSTIVNQFVASKVDLIMANATASLQAAAAATQDIPVVGTSITDYGTALEMKLNDGKTGRNITGTADLAPLDKQADLFSQLLPDAKKIGIVYCSAEANSKFQVDTVKGHLEEKGLTVTEYPFADSNDISTIVKKAVDESDALYIPTDNTAANNTELISNIAEPAGKAIIAGEEGICEGCGVATLSISYYDIGVAAAEIAYDILVNGKNAGDIEIGYAATQTPKYVKDRAEALKIEIPESFEEIVPAESK